MAKALQAVEHFLRESLRFVNPGLRIFASANAYADETGTFENIENSGSGTGHPKCFVADAGYFLWRPRLAFLFFFFVAVKSISPELPRIARACAGSSLSNNQADGVGKRRQCKKTLRNFKTIGRAFTQLGVFQRLTLN